VVTYGRRVKMWTFIVSGALYLVGVAVVLVIKPSFMFTPDGNWKEFGIGQSEARYTTFPFWLFCLVWAVACYVIVLLTLPLIIDTEPVEANEYTENVYKNNKKPKVKKVVEESDLLFDDEIEPVKTLPKGYYVLNKKASRLAGTPKYVFIAEES
jgi:hypothetical protein